MVDNDDRSVCSTCSTDSSCSINSVGNISGDYDVVFTDRETEQIRNDLGCGVHNGKIIHVTVDLTLNDDNDHPSISAPPPSTPSTPSAQLHRVTPPTLIGSILYE
jgi:hypothetical protein